MKLGLTGKFALVTGGSHGIGRRVALSLADEGCNVAICARNEDRIRSIVEEIKDRKVEGIGINTDVLVPSDITKCFHEIISSWGTLHILINNVGGGGRWGSQVIEETSEDVWVDVYSKNAMAAARFTRLFIPHMRKQKWGRVVTIASIHGREGGGRPWFNMAKAAEISLMKTLAVNKRYARHNITFNSVAPGAIMIPDTGWDKLRRENPKEFNDFVEELPLGRLGTPEEVANLVVFLCSEQAGLVNGACIVVDGGESKSF